MGGCRTEPPGRRDRGWGDCILRMGDRHSPPLSPSPRNLASTTSFPALGAPQHP